MFCPEAHTSDRSRDILGGVTGLMVLLLALVLGLLIWTAYGVTQTQKGEIQLLAARALEFDLEMKQYGPEAAKARDMLRTEFVWAHEQFWGEGQAKADAFNVSYGNMASMDAFLNGLKPATDDQRRLLTAASGTLRRDWRDPPADVAAAYRSGLLAADLHGHFLVVSAFSGLWDTCRAPTPPR